MKKRNHKYLNIHLSLIICVVIISYSCDSKEECIPEIEFNKDRNPPVIAILGQKDDSNCTYRIDFNYWFEHETISTSGLLQLRDSAFYIKLHQPKTNYVKYFDFNKEKRETYQFELLDSNSDCLINVKIDNIIRLNNQNIFVFRFFNSFEYLSNRTDTIILASLSQGIIGSYFTYQINGKEFMLEPRGDILKEEIDYSNVELRILR